MNKSMMTGLVAGIGIAAAGGVVGLTLMNGGSSEDEAVVAIEAAEPAAAAVPAAAAPAPAPAVAAAPRAQSQPAQPAPAAEECWEEQVVVQAEARDDKRIAGTAAGALIGGALGDRLGDGDDLVTAAGAAAGAYLGRRAQGEYQENQTAVTTEVRCAPAGSR
jgi:uncharacterized protein YcfJ